MANVNLVNKPTTVLKTIYPSMSTIDNYPVSLDFVDTPLIWQFNSEVLNNTNDYSQLVLTPTYDINQPFSPLQDVVEGDTYTINGVVFTAKNNPHFVSEFQAGDSQYGKQIVNSLISSFNQNGQLNYKYTAFLIEDQTITGYYAVVIRPKYAGPAYNFTASASFTNHTQPISSNKSVNPTSRGQKLQNYQYKTYVDVFKLRDTDYMDLTANPDEQLLISLYKNWNSSNQFYFDISEALKGELEYYTPSPYQSGLGASYQTTFTFEPNQLVGYKLKYGESFLGGYDLSTGDPVDDQNNITNLLRRNFEIGDQEKRWATFGAFALNNNNVCSDDYFNFDIDNKLVVKPLTNRPPSTIRKRLNNTPYFFSTLLWDDGEFSGFGAQPTPYRIRYNNYNLLYELESSGTTNNTQVNRNGIYSTSISDETLEVTNSANQILKTEWWVQTFRDDEWYDYTEVQEFEWDLNNEIEDVERVYFRNLFGQIDQYTFGNKRVDTIKVDRQTFQKNYSLTIGNDRSDGIDNVINVNMVEEVTLDSGWVDKDTYEWLKEMVVATDVYLLDRDFDTYSSININTNNLYPTADEGTFEGGVVGHDVVSQPFCDSGPGTPIFLGLSSVPSNVYAGAISMAVVKDTNCRIFDDTFQIQADTGVTLTQGNTYILRAKIKVNEGWSSFDMGGEIKLSMSLMTDAVITTTQTYDINNDPRSTWVNIESEIRVNTDTYGIPIISFPNLVTGEDRITLLYVDNLEILDQNSTVCKDDQTEYLEKYYIDNQDWEIDNERDLYNLNLTLVRSTPYNSQKR